MSLIPSFTLHLGQEILEGKAAIGCFGESRHPSLVCATTGNRLFLHSPHQESSTLRFLNMQQEVVSLAAGRLGDSDEDLLLVGFPAHLMAYDVVENATMFYRDVPDGISALLVGQIGELPFPAGLVGGNCSIQAFDSTGREVFWTVTGDRVSALALCDVDGNGQQELIVASDDHEIRIFSNEQVVCELTESDRAIALASVRGAEYGFALANGVIGIHDGNAIVAGSSGYGDVDASLARRWRIKSAHKPTCLIGFDLDKDGVPELVSGWDNGCVEVRSADTGKVIFKADHDASVSALLSADYRKDGKVSQRTRFPEQSTVKRTILEQ